MICPPCKALTIDRLYARAREYVSTSKSTWNQTGYLELHSSYTSLHGAAEDGCTNCQAFYQRFIDSHGGPEALKEKAACLSGSQDRQVPVIAFLQIGFREGDKYPIQKLHLQIGSEPWKPGVDPLSIAFKVNRPRDYLDTGKDEYVFRYTELDNDLGSDTNFAVAHNWIRDCVENHDHVTCPPICDNALPTRLIDVSPVDYPECPRLVQPAKGEKGRYLALSHCWGPSTVKERLTTTKATLASRLKSIPTAKMPANFHDATIITRRLGYRYLWIDSLCIVQDSLEDWEAESQNMGNIYTNASLTIAAAAAKDSDGGMLRKDYNFKDMEATLNLDNWFLQDRKKINSYALTHEKVQKPTIGKEDPDSYQLQPCYLKIHDDSQSQTVTLEPWLAFSDKEENWFRCTVVGPLAHRGWCLQERLLSRRVLYFGQRQIYWQCTSSRKAADGEEVLLSAATSSRNLGNGFSEWPDLLGLKRLHDSLNGQQGQLISPEERQKIERNAYKTWHNVLFLYVNRRLTYQTDKLPGLAGMAEMIHSLTGDTYVAGFWRRYLLVSLIWTSMSNSVREYELRSIAELYEIDTPQWELEQPFLEGPSWSWASANVSDRLNFWGDHDEKYRTRIWTEQDAEIMEVEVDHVGKLKFGRVKGGRLVLRGHTYRRWDVRTSGWDPMDSISSIILGLCPQSPWNRDKHETCQDKTVIWDYGPRQRYTSVIRLLLHIALWLLNVCTIGLWPGTTFNGWGQKSKASCPACMEYLGLHVLSIVDRESSCGKGREVDLWSLILEPVLGRKDVYRRIGIARKSVYVPEENFICLTGSKTTEMRESKPFSSWNLKTVEVI